MILVIEIVCCSILFAILLIWRIKTKPEWKIQDMPKVLQKKVVRKREYRRKNFKIFTEKEKTLKRLPFYILSVVLLTVMMWFAGARSFAKGFIYSFLLCATVKLVCVLVIDCGWYAHNKKVWIDGTEELAPKSYQNYRYYFGTIPRAMLIAAFMAVFTGFFVDIMPRMENDNYADKYTEVNDILNEAVKNYNVPGISVMVVDSEGILFSDNYGKCKSSQTPFVVGALGKSFTASCIMKLSREGSLRLEHTVDRYVDAKKYFKDPSDAKKITIRQLLNNTSGLGVYQHLGNAKIVNKNGQYTYANINYDLLGKVIESVTGETYNEYLTKNILKPLGMYNTSADERTAKENGLIQGHRNYFGVNLPSAAKFPDEDSWATESAGYITSSAADMGKYLQMFLRGGYGVVSEKGISTMLYNRVPTEKSGKYQYGMGWLYTDEYVEPVFNHSGRAQNYMSSMYLLPESDMGIVILADTNDYLVTNDLMDQISNKVMLTLLGHATKELDPYAYEDSHMIINLIYIALVLIGIVEIIRARKWKRNTEGNMIINIFLHLLLPTAILLLPVIIGVPYWVIWEYARDSFIALTLSAFLLYIGGLMKLKK